MCNIFKHNYLLIIFFHFLFPLRTLFTWKKNRCSRKRREGPVHKYLWNNLDQYFVLDIRHIINVTMIGIIFLPFSISFCFRWFRFPFVGFVLFRFHFVDFVSSRFVSFLLISFRFVSFRVCWFRFVSFIKGLYYYVRSVQLLPTHVCLSSGEDRIWSPLNKNTMHLFSGSLAVLFT
jgi:hypothetical protein